MEGVEINPKEFSIGKRSKKFSNCREKRKADPNGQKLKKRYWNPLDDAFKISKHKNNTNGVELGLTPFEESIGINITETGISLQNQKLLNKINSLLLINGTNNNDNNNNINKDTTRSSDHEEEEEEENDTNINNIEYDEKYEISKHGLCDNMNYLRGYNSSSKNCQRIYLAYYNINELNLKYENNINKIKSYNYKSGLNGLNKKDCKINELLINKYIKDKHYNKMVYKSSIITYNQWLKNHLSLPKQIYQFTKKNSINNNNNNNNINSFVYLLKNRGVSFTSRTFNGNDCVIHRCGIHNFGIRSYWTPFQKNDGRDYLQIDLKYNYHINAISTRGRPLKRDTNKENQNNYEIFPGWPIEYVKRYRLYVKIDDNVDSNNNEKIGKKHNKFKNKNSNNKNNNNNNNNDKVWQLNGDWLDVGEFIGNKDSETENCHIISSKHIIGRYLRFVPLNRNKDGFFGRKSMRVGVYGKRVKQTKKENTNIENTVIITNNNEDEDSKDTNNKKDREFSSSELTMTRPDTPSVIISINLPSKAKNNLMSKNGYGTHVYQGVDCSCRMCSYESEYARQENRKKRRQLKQISNKWKKSMNTKIIY